MSIEERLAALEQELKLLRDRIAALEAAPSAGGSDARFAEIERRIGIAAPVVDEPAV